MSKRKLPAWMLQQKKNVSEALNNIVDQTEIVPPRRLRSNFSFPDNEIEEENKTQNVDVSLLPFVEYTGKIFYFTDVHDICLASDKLLSFVENSTSEKVYLAFDMEWPFSFQTGPGITSVIQICAELDKCYVFQLTNIPKIPLALKQLLNHPKVVLHGNNIKNDLRKLERDFPAVKTQSMIENCIDLGVFCNEVYVTSGRWSLERLALQICKMRIKKERNVRMSKWNVIPLTEDQQKYAAIDVYISQLIMIEMQRKKVEESAKLENFFEMYGDESGKGDEKINKQDLNDEIAQLLS